MSLLEARFFPTFGACESGKCCLKNTVFVMPIKMDICHPLENDSGEELGLIWKAVTTSKNISSYARACTDVFQLNSF